MDFEKRLTWQWRTLWTLRGKRILFIVKRLQARMELDLAIPNIVKEDTVYTLEGGLLRPLLTEDRVADVRKETDARI